MMWPFFKNQKQPQAAEQTSGARVKVGPRPMKFTEIVEGMGDFSDLRNHDCALKFWLSEPAMEALREMCARNGDSVSEVLRQFFAHHCYGIYAYYVMTDAIPNLFKEPEPPRFRTVQEKIPVGKKRVTTYWVPELGKNVMPVKIWIAQRMRDDLQVLADHVDLKLSQYAREIVISRILGHGTLPHRPEMLNAAPLPAAEKWCRGQKVEMREVDHAYFYRHADGESRSEWVDV